jgi:hypothetical protein
MRVDQKGISEIIGYDKQDKHMVDISIVNKTPPAVTSIISSISPILLGIPHVTSTP